MVDDTHNKKRPLSYRTHSVAPPPNPVDPRLEMNGAIITQKICRSSFGESLEILYSSIRQRQILNHLRNGAWEDVVLLFVHGTFGCAENWRRIMEYFSLIGDYPCYAVSLRGHGQSHKPSYSNLVWGSGVGGMASDLKFALWFVDEQERILRKDGSFSRKKLVLIGHGAGGGLCQYVLGTKETAGGLVLLSSFPSLGAHQAWKWLKLDPWAPLRFLKHFGHPRSALRSRSQIQNTFFSAGTGRDVEEFERNMPRFESLWWPLRMMLPIASQRRVCQNLVVTNDEERRILILEGMLDNLIAHEETHDTFVKYRKAFAKLSNNEGVQMQWIESSGHQIPNDGWLEACYKIRTFLDSRKSSQVELQEEEFSKTRRSL